MHSACSQDSRHGASQIRTPRSGRPAALLGACAAFRTQVPGRRSRCYGDGVRAFLAVVRRARPHPRPRPRPDQGVRRRSARRRAPRPATARSRQLGHAPLLRVARGGGRDRHRPTPRTEGAQARRPRSPSRCPRTSCAALIKACGRARSFRDRRDEAIVRLMAETGMRAGEVCGLHDRRSRPDPRIDDRAPRQGRQGPGGTLRRSDRRLHRPLSPGPPDAPARPRRRRCGSVSAARAWSTTGCTRR